METENTTDNLKKTSAKYKDILKQSSNAILLTYLVITVFIIIWAFFKKFWFKNGPPNNANKMIRLINFFWWKPTKIYIILNVMLALILLFTKMFSILFTKIKDKHFPALFSILLNYGVLFSLLLYTVFPKFIYIIIGIYFVMILTAGLFNINSNNENESIFPYKLTNHGKRITDLLSDFSETDNFVLQIFYLFVASFYILLFVLFIFSVALSIIPLSYFIVFIYTFQIPVIPEMNSFTLS